MIAPILDAVAKDYEDRLRVVKLNLDENPQTPAKYNIRSIPTLLLFKDGAEREYLEEATEWRTTLTAWFALNAASSEAHAYRYVEVPEHYTWQKQQGLWKKRTHASSGDRIIGRLHGALPSEGERYYLYLVLLHERGATSFEALKGDLPPDATWREVAEAKGLAKRLANGPAMAIRGTKHAINKKVWNDLNLALDMGLALEERSSRHPDHHEAARSFVEKRPPEYKGAI